MYQETSKCGNPTLTKTGRMGHVVDSRHNLLLGLMVIDFLMNLPFSSIKPNQVKALEVFSLIVWLDFVFFRLGDSLNNK